MELFWILVAVAIVVIAAKVHHNKVVADRYSAAYENPAVGCAVGFWTQALEKGFEGLKECTKKRFANILRCQLARRYAATGSIPEIGAFNYAPYKFGLCPILWHAFWAAGIGNPINRDIAHGHFRAHGRMRITLDEVRLTGGLFSSGPEQIIWPPERATKPAAVLEAAGT